MNTTIFNDNSELHIITEKIFNFTQEIFVLNFNITKFPGQKVAKEITEVFLYIIFLFLTVIFSATILKILLIFLYFCVITVILNIYRHIVYLVKNRFCVDIRRICCDVFYFLIRVTKKIYTYNFYSYDRSEFFVAAIMNTIFLIFITSNIIYIILSRNDFIYIDDNQIKEEESIQKKALYFIAFETHLFLEILCPIYYRGLTFKTSLNMTFIYLIYSNVLSSIVIALILNDGYYDLLLKKLSHMIYVMISIYLYSRAFRAIYNTDLNDFSWKIYFREKENLLNQRRNLSSRRIIEMEQTRIEELRPDVDIFLKNTYSQSDDKNFFKRRNRYYYKNLLKYSYGGLLLTFIMELVYVILRILILENKDPRNNISNNNDDNIPVAIRNATSCVFTVIHMSLITFISWNLLMKLEIKTIILY